MYTNVPIATLAGINSLTDLLPELPLPSPSVSKRKDTLLHSSTVANEAREILARPDRPLVQQLTQALQISKPTTDQLIFKEDVSQPTTISCQEGPMLLQAIISHTPTVFSSQPENPLTDCYQNAQAYSPAGYGHVGNHHRVSPSKVRSPLYAGSPGSAQPQSPYQQALQHSPSDHVNRVHQMASSQHQVAIQSRSPVACSSYSGRMSTAQQNSGNPLVTRNLNDQEFYHHVTQAQVQSSAADVYNQVEYNSMSALEALASQNGFNFGASVLGQASQQLAALTENQRNASLKPAASPKTLHYQEIDSNRSCGSSSKPKKKRKSRSKSELDVNNSHQVSNFVSQAQISETDVNSLFNEYNTPVNEKCTQHQRPSKLGWRSVEDQNTNTDLIATEVMNEGLPLAPMSAMDLNIQNNRTPDRTDKPMSTKDGSGDNIKSLSPTLKLSPALKGIPLYVPKLVITKIRQRRGSKEIETHQVREVSPGSDNTTLQRLKKRRRSSEEKSHHNSYSDEAPPKKKSKAKKRRKQESCESDDIMELPAFKKFGDLLENLFEFDDECDAPSFHDVDDQEPNPETLLSRSIVTEFYTETAKLKSLRVLHKIPCEDLMRLLTVMERHVRDGLHIQLQCNADQDDNDEQRLWRGLCLERMVRAVESSLVVLIVLTSPSMPKQLFLEEVIDRVISLAKFELKNNIYPEYDPLYRETDSNESVLMMPKVKRAKSSQPKLKSMVLFYNKVCELVSLLGDLVDIQALTDTDVLQVSNLGTSPFFVENISDLQHSALKLVRSIFRKYLKHRDLILEEIFTSLARLPSSKRTLRSYRLSGEVSIQMVTALVLQLIQCSVKIPDKADDISEATGAKDGGDENKSQVDRNLLIITSYENALRTAQNFLSMFLNKCISVGKDEEDYRPLFENFLQDLLVTLNRPDWPAAEVLLTLLGKLLIVTFNNKGNDVSLRVSAIDYLGVVAAHLRKDAVNSQQDTEGITEILVEKALAHWLGSEGNSDAAFMFFLAQWIRDTHVEMERSLRAPADDPLESGEGLKNDALLSAQSLAKLEDRKTFLFFVLDGGTMTSLRSSQNHLDYEQATLVARYLASSRSFSKSFDAYLSQILRVLNESAVAIRTKAMKSLSAVISADPSILSREDMQKGVHSKFVDMSTSVREAAVELIGRFVLNKPELILQYYDMIIERILDTGISVRKRVIKILRDICINHPDFPKTTEIYVKIIRRICDEEGIKELVTKVFQQMWFTPLKGDENSEVLVKRVCHMTDVVAACGDSGDWFEQLLENLLHNEEDSVSQASEVASGQIVNCLVENVLSLEERAVAQSEGKGSSSQRLVSSLSTLYLISKIKPQLLVKHATTLQPYLSTKCTRILELVVPLMEHPSETFLASLEEDLMRLTVKYGQTVVQSCISCLGAVVNKVTHNIRLGIWQKLKQICARIPAKHSTTSAVMQVYLKSVLDSLLHPHSSIRMASLHVVNLILRQGLVHPVQCVPYLIAIGTDDEPQMRVKSDQQLTEIDSKYSMFVQMKALAGIKMSFELQRLVQREKNTAIRGYRKESNQCLLSHLYSIIRTGRQPRRSLLQSMLRIFDDPKGSKVDLLLYIADNLAHFPYSIHEEPLFVIYHIDTILSVAGANMLQSFKEAMIVQTKPIVQEGNNPPGTEDNYYDEEETLETVLAKIPPDPTNFEKCCVASQGCLLLLYLKQHLKEMYGFSDSKCHKYSPSEPAKAYDKTVSRKTGVLFEPEQVLRYVEEPEAVRSHEQLVHDYLEFKCLMMRLDPSEEDSDDSMNGGRESPVGEGQLLDLEGNPIAKTRDKRASKPRKVNATVDLDQSLFDESEEEVDLLCQ
ncbi:Nipped-B-like protein B [Acropora cervicornis]|uniref:Nipped-B protein n=1 Tax=Acropora cervicornis TaxID=6130 RepID=A0AAD9V0D2_ACRCE|nr:Nipped-B-like protein B [Acropora cervicornis]